MTNHGAREKGRQRKSEGTTERERLRGFRSDQRMYLLSKPQQCIKLKGPRSLNKKEKKELSLLPTTDQIRSLNVSVSTDKNKTKEKYFLPHFLLN